MKWEERVRNDNRPMILKENGLSAETCFAGIDSLMLKAKKLWILMEI